MYSFRLCRDIYLPFIKNIIFKIWGGKYDEGKEEKKGEKGEIMNKSAT